MQSVCISLNPVILTEYVHLIPRPNRSDLNALIIAELPRREHALRSHHRARRPVHWSELPRAQHRLIISVHKIASYSTMPASLTQE